MKRAIAICLALAALAATADTNTVEELEHIRYHMEQAREMYRDSLKEFRRLQHEYDEACLKAGITNARRKVSASNPGTTFTKSQRKFFENRRICVSRDTTSVPGFVITTWHRNGKPDTKGPAVVTNVLHNIAGTIQNNPLQGRIAELAAQYSAAVERATSAEARAARLDALRSWLVEQRDKALLETTRKIYQAIIDRLDSGGQQ